MADISRTVERAAAGFGLDPERLRPLGGRTGSTWSHGHVVLRVGERVASELAAAAAAAGHVPVPAVLDRLELEGATAVLLEKVAGRPAGELAVDDERRRIERDLHDGAQQRLVALRIRLELAAELASERPRSGAAEAAARRFGDDFEEALQSVRSLASGIYPPTLADHGLVAALRARRRLKARCRPRSWRRVSGATLPRSKAPCTSAASKPSRHGQARTKRERRGDRTLGRGIAPA